MAITSSFSQANRASGLSQMRVVASLFHAWSGLVMMWLFWISFVVFLAQPSRILDWWPLPTVDGGADLNATTAAIVDMLLITFFGLQHSLMARPWFKAQAFRLPPPFERSTFVHMANVALFALILFWQPIPIELWSVSGGMKDALWVGFGLGWITLLAGAWSFGIRRLLGIEQMRTWDKGLPPEPPRLKTGAIYRWLQHPMYVGVLMGVWITPRMTVGHLLLAGGLTTYVQIGMRYEKRDLARQFGRRYEQWRSWA